MGIRTVVGQQTQDKEFRPPNTDVAGLPGGIKVPGSKPIKKGDVSFHFIFSCYSKFLFIKRMSLLCVNR